jgi:hypothetical protein
MWSENTFGNRTVACTAKVKTSKMTAPAYGMNRRPRGNTQAAENRGCFAEQGWDKVVRVMAS